MVFEARYGVRHRTDGGTPRTDYDRLEAVCQLAAQRPPVRITVVFASRAVSIARRPMLALGSIGTNCGAPKTARQQREVTERRELLSLAVDDE